MTRTRTRRKLGGGGNYLNWKELLEGDWFVGKLTSVTQDQHGKARYDVELEEFETSAMINVTKANPSGDKAPEVGMTVTFNETTAFRNQMDKLDTGAIVEIRYNGKAPLPKTHTYSGTMAHQIEVFELADDDAAVGTPDL